MISDFYIIKRRALDVPGLYQPKGRYSYRHGINWRALVALLLAVGPTLPGLAYNVNPKLDIGGALYIANFNWYYGIVVAAATYTTLSFVFPAAETVIPFMIEGLIEGNEVDNTDDMSKAPYAVEKKV